MFIDIPGLKVFHPEPVFRPGGPLAEMPAAI
jgi:hypothetical protein